MCTQARGAGWQGHHVPAYREGASGAMLDARARAAASARSAMCGAGPRSQVEVVERSIAPLPCQQLRRRGGRRRGRSTQRIRRRAAYQSGTRRCEEEARTRLRPQGCRRTVHCSASARMWQPFAPAWLLLLHGGEPLLRRGRGCAPQSAPPGWGGNGSLAPLHAPLGGACLTKNGHSWVPVMRWLFLMRVRLSLFAAEPRRE